MVFMRDRGTHDDLHWYHAQIRCFGQWLPGDERGFRHRGHRIHSSGDYKHRPPQDEHDGLRRHTKQQMTQDPVTFIPRLRPVVLECIRNWFACRSNGLLAASAGGAHCHLLCQLQQTDPLATAGWLKKYVSQRLSEHDASLPSRIFAARGDPIPIRDRDHLRNTYDYIVVKHAAEGAAVWGCPVHELDSVVF